MRCPALSFVIAGTALALIVAAPVGAVSSARKDVLRIDVKGGPQGGNPSGGGGTFTLHVGSQADKGTQYYSFGAANKGNITLTGRRGELVLRTRATNSGLHVDSQGTDLWTGMWTIVSGTGSYAGAHGVGAYVGIVGPGYRIALHFEGFRM